MLLSYSHSFIFFHVAKVAGTSIREALAPYTQEPEYFKICRPPQYIDGHPNIMYEMWKTMLLHATVGQTQQALPNEFNTFYTFAFVRNPWDWQISMYHFLLQEKSNPRYEKIYALGSFKNYLQWLIDEPRPFPKGATKLQKSMLVDQQGKIAVQRVGRFENINADFAEISASLGINAQLPKRNTTERKEYRHYYDDSSKKLVAQHFAEDIDLFKYTF